MAARNEQDSESSTRVKTEFLSQMQGLEQTKHTIIVLGATNVPWVLDSAFRRRFERRIYIPLPGLEARIEMIKLHMKNVEHTLSEEALNRIAAETENYSGSDMEGLVRDVMYMSVRRLNQLRNDLTDFSEKTKQLSVITEEDFNVALKRSSSTVDLNDIKKYEAWTAQYGLKIFFKMIYIHILEGGFSLFELIFNVKGEMVKSYLRYVYEKQFGLMASTEANAVFGDTNQAIISAASDNVIFWNIKSMRRESQILLQSVRSVYATFLKKSFSGNIIAVGCSDGAIRLYENLNLRATFHGHKSGISYLEFSLDDQYLVSGGWDTEIIVWDLVTEMGLHRLSGHKQKITQLQFVYPPINSCSEEKKKKKKRNATSADHENKDYDFIEFSMNPTYIISGSVDGTVKIWDFASQWCAQTIILPTSQIDCFSVDLIRSHLYVILRNRSIYVYSLHYGSLNDSTASLIGEGQRYGSQPVSQIFLVSEPKLLHQHVSENSKDSIAKITAFGTCILTSNRHIGFSCFRRLMLFVSPKQNCYEVYRLYTDKDIEINKEKRLRRTKHSLKKKKERLEELKKKLADSESLSNLLVVENIPLQLKREETLQKIQDTENLITSLKKSNPLAISDFFNYLISSYFQKKPHFLDIMYSTDLLILVQYADSTLETFKVKVELLLEPKKEHFTESMLEEIKPQSMNSLHSIGHSNNLVSISMTRNDAYIATLDTETLKIWRAETGEVTNSVQLSEKVTCGLFVSGDDYMVIGTARGTVMLIDLRECVVTQAYTDNSSKCMCIVETADDNGFIVGRENKHLEFFNYHFEVLPSKIERVQFEFQKSIEMSDVPLDIKFSKDKRLIAVSLLDFTIQTYYADTFKLHLTLYGHKLPANCIDFIEDSSILATGSMDKTIKLWGTKFGDMQKSWIAHEESVLKVHFVLNTQYLLSSGGDKVIKMWDVSTKDLIQTFGGFTKGVCGVLASPTDALYIIGAASNGEVRMWIRTEEQLFLQEEKEERLDAELDENAVNATGSMNPQEVYMTRATRRDLTSVKSTEQLMETLELVGKMKEELKNYEAAVRCYETIKNEKKKISSSLDALTMSEKPTAPDLNMTLMGKSPEHYLFDQIKEIPSTVLHEVVVALPYSFAEKLLDFVNSILIQLDTATTDAAGMSYIEKLTKVTLLTIQVHMRQLLTATAPIRETLLSIKTLLRPLLQREKERAELLQSSMTLLQKRCKNSLESIRFEQFQKGVHSPI